MLAQWRANYWTGLFHGCYKVRRSRQIFLRSWRTQPCSWKVMRFYVGIFQNGLDWRHPLFSALNVSDTWWNPLFRDVEPIKFRLNKQIERPFLRRLIVFIRPSMAQHYRYKPKRIHSLACAMGSVWFTVARVRSMQNISFLQYTRTLSSGWKTGGNFVWCNFRQGSIGSTVISHFVCKSVSEICYVDWWVVNGFSKFMDGWKIKTSDFFIKAPVFICWIRLFLRLPLSPWIHHTTETSIQPVSEMRFLKFLIILLLQPGTVPCTPTKTLCAELVEVGDFGGGSWGGGGLK